MPTKAGAGLQPAAQASNVPGDKPGLPHWWQELTLPGQEALEGS